MHDNTQRIAQAICLAAAIWMLPDTAWAQVGFGGGGGFMGGFMNYLSGTVILVLSTLAVIIIGCIMMAARASWIAIGSTVMGIWVVSNAQMLAGLFAQ